MTLLSLRSIFLATVLALAGMSAQAQNQGGVCKADAQKLCKGTKPGGGRVIACLQQHEAELTPACKEQLPTLAACGEEMKKVCGEAGPRKMRECAKTNADKLKAVCKGHEDSTH
jgi:hypothetical protein